MDANERPQEKKKKKKEKEEMFRTDGFRDSFWPPKATAAARTSSKVTLGWCMHVFSIGSYTHALNHSVV